MAAKQFTYMPLLAPTPPPKFIGGIFEDEGIDTPIGQELQKPLSDEELELRRKREAAQVHETQMNRLRPVIEPTFSKRSSGQVDSHFAPNSIASANIASSDILPVKRGYSLYAVRLIAAGSCKHKAFQVFREITRTKISMKQFLEKVPLTIGTDFSEQEAEEILNKLSKVEAIAVMIKLC